MPHAAFYVVQLVGGYVCMTFSKVSMPHAAFYVVQLAELQGILAVTSFNAARSILCGATQMVSIQNTLEDAFQCRTQHYMWCNR